MNGEESGRSKHNAGNKEFGIWQTINRMILKIIAYKIFYTDVKTRQNLCSLEISFASSLVIFLYTK